MKLTLVFGVIVVVVGFAAIYAWRRSRSITSNPFHIEGISIYEFINNNLVPATGDLRESVGDLPDEQRRTKPGDLRWAPGGLDGVFGHHGGGEQAAQKAARVASLVRQIAQTGSGDAQNELYTLLLDGSLLDCLDAAIEQMAKLRIPVTPELRQFARTMAMRSPDRGPVKFAISLLGIIRNPQDVEVISLLGKHEEFTLYAAVALTNALADPEPALFDLAQHVHGWGRIHTVERLAKTKNPVIKRWLLLKGYDNSVMHEYLACICAQAGELQVALAAESVDNELLNAATDLLRALIAGGPALDINDYEYAGSAVTNYLRHIERGSLELSRFVVVQSLADYLRGSSWGPAAREKNGWTEALRKARSLPLKIISVGENGLI